MDSSEKAFEAALKLVRRQRHQHKLDNYVSPQDEMEIKVDLVSRDQVDRMAQMIRKHFGGILTYKERLQMDVIHADTPNEYGSISTDVLGNKQPKAKRKSLGHLIDANGVWVYNRREEKRTHKHDDYDAFVDGILAMQCVGSLLKHCLDITFRCRGELDQLIQITISKCSKRIKQSGALYQMEFESAGFNRKHRTPVFGETMDTLRATTLTILGTDADFSELTKPQWLAEGTAHEDKFPRYQSISAQEANSIYEPPEEPAIITPDPHVFQIHAELQNIRGHL